MKLIRGANFTAILDACVLYPIVVRDYLMCLATYQLYTPKWSEEILAEFEAVFTKHKPKTDLVIIKRQVDFVRNHNFSAMVHSYDSIDLNIKIPDPKDYHVVKAAVKCNANRIVTNNLKHFPNDQLNQIGLCAIDPDNFIADLIDLSPKAAVDAYRQMVVIKNNPPYSEAEYLDVLRNNGLHHTASELTKYI